MSGKTCYIFWMYYKKQYDQEVEKNYESLGSISYWQAEKNKENSSLGDLKLKLVSFKISIICLNNRIIHTIVFAKLIFVQLDRFTLKS